VLTLSQYISIDEAWSKTIAANGKNTLTVNKDVDINPENTYYVFINQPHFNWWSLRGKIVELYVKKAVDPKDMESLKDWVTKGSDIMSYVKHWCAQILSGITPYTFYMQGIGAKKDDIILGRMISARNSVYSNILFVNANAMDDQPSLTRYLEITRELEKEICPDVYSNIKQVIPFIQDRINSYNTYKQGTANTGGEWDIAGLEEAKANIVYQGHVEPSLVWGKYKIFKVPTMSTSIEDAVNKNYVGRKTLENLKALEEVGFKFYTFYKCEDGSSAYSGVDNNNEEVLYVRKTNTQSGVSLYYKNKPIRRALDVFKSLWKETKLPVNVFVKNCLNEFKRIRNIKNFNIDKYTKIRQDGKIDFYGDCMVLEYMSENNLKDYRLNNTRDIPIQFGKVHGNFELLINIVNFDWFPEEIDGYFKFFEPSAGWFTKEKQVEFARLGLYKRVKGDIRLLSNYQPFNRIFDSSYWEDLIKADDTYKQSTASTGGEWDIGGF